MINNARGSDVIILKRKGHIDFVFISFLYCPWHFIYYFFFDFLFFIE